MAREHYLPIHPKHIREAQQVLNANRGVRPETHVPDMSSSGFSFNSLALAIGETMVIRAETVKNQKEPLE